ncbi:MAG: hypothetical protein GX285_09405 [Clostridiales bacterium]|nr:hypothetical protein [Clostridiales bacterium]
MVTQILAICSVIVLALFIIFSYLEYKVLVYIFGVLFFIIVLAFFYWGRVLTGDIKRKSNVKK